MERTPVAGSSCFEEVAYAKWPELSDATESLNGLMEKERVSLQFSRAARRYDQYARVQLQMRDQLLNWWDLHVPRSAPATRHLVDLGCGTGGLLGQLEARNNSAWEWYGADLAQGMIEIAAKLTSARLTCCDLEATPYANGMFDAVVSSATLQWCNLELAVAEVSRILKPAGFFWFSTLGAATLREWREALNAIGMPEERVHQFEDADVVCQTLESQGFYIEESKRTLLVDTYPTPKQLVRSVRAIGASNANVGQGDSYFGRTQYRDFLDALQSQSDAGDCSATYEALWFRCTRNA